MKILLDMNLSPAWVKFLASEGYNARHWSKIGDVSATDAEIMEWARHNDYSVFTHDLDFSTLLFLTGSAKPSVIQLRTEDIRPEVVGKFVLQALLKSANAIRNGAIVTINPKQSRIRLLPLK